MPGYLVEQLEAIVMLAGLYGIVRWLGRRLQARERCHDSRRHHRR